MRKYIVIIAYCTSLFFLACDKSEDFNSINKNTGDYFNSKVVQGVVRIKFKNESIDKLKFFEEAGTVRSRSRNVDSVFNKVKIASIKRTFPFSGKFENRSKKEGLHLWYDAVYDTKNITLDKAINEFKGLQEIEVTESIAKIKLCNVNSSRYLESSSITNDYPYDDEFLSDQWHYYNDGTLPNAVLGADINLFDAWLKETGDENVVVAVVDGGIDVNHEDLKVNVWQNPGELGGSTNIDDDNNGYADDINGYNFVAKNGKIKAHDHGTHVAGTIGAVTGNGIGVSGIAGGNGNMGGVKLMSCQVFSTDESGEEVSAQSFAEAIKYAADNGAVICQNSWGYEELDNLPESMKNAIDYFVSYAGVDENGDQYGPLKGGVVIFAAGNENTTIAYPASYENVVSVASIAPDFTKAYYSNYGDWVDISAPGGTVPQGDKYNTKCQVLSTLPENRYGYMQGTSMACPHVSGVAALIVSMYGGPGFTNEMLKQRLFQGAVDLDQYNSRYKANLGVGLINAAAGLANSESEPPAVVTDVSAVGYSNNIDVAWSVTSDPDDIKAAGYVVYYSKEEFTLDNIKADDSNLQSKQIEVGQLSIGDPLTVTLSNLDFESNYYIGIIGYDILMTYSDLSALEIVLTEANNKPIIETQSPNDIEIKPFESKLVQFVISDPDNHSITWNYVDDSGYSVANEVNSYVQIVINGIGAISGSYTGELIVQDSYGASEIYNLRYKILPNHPPVISQVIDNVYLGASGASYNLELSQYFSDEDGENLTYAVEYDNSILHVTVNQGVLYISSKKLGLSTVSVVGTDASGESKSQSFLVMVRDNSEELDVYPNPFSDHINIRMGEGVDGDVTIKMFNSSGKEVFNNNFMISTFSPVKMNVSDLSVGSYILKVDYNGQTYQRNVVKL